MNDARCMIGAVAAVLGLLAGQALSQEAKPSDWPQWRGPGRDGKAVGLKVPAAWPAQLTQRWKVPVGAGDASPVVASGKVYVFVRQGGDEVTLCLNAADGKEVWRDAFPVAAITGPDASAHSGPRSTPAVAEGKVVTLGVTGVLTCLDAGKGTVVWRKDENKGTPRFHTASSPIIVDGLAIAQLGPEGTGAIVACELATGKEKWQCANQGAAYASPVLATIENTRMIVTLTDKNVVGIGLADGKLLWSVPFAAGYNAATPIVADGGIVIVSGMGRVGTKALRVSRTGDSWKAEEVWANPLGVMYCTPVMRDGFLYAISDKGSMFCLNARTGETVWTDPVNKLGNFGAMLDAGGAVLCLPSRSELLVIKPGVTEYAELARYRVGDGQIFACPAVSGGWIYVKDKDSVIAWTLE